jgi:AcrR family transcriptional regulator
MSDLSLAIANHRFGFARLVYDYFCSEPYINQVIAHSGEANQMHAKGLRHARRGRPRTFNRGSALATATELFWKKGYEATSIADLCSSIGIEAPSLYAAFGSKETLYCECLDHYQRTISPLIWNGLETARTAREGFASVLYGTARVLPSTIRASGCMVTLSAAGANGETALGKKVKAERGAGLKRLEGRLRRGVADGDVVRRVNIKAISRFFLDIQQGMAVQARDGANTRILREIASLAMKAWPVLTDPDN